MNGNRCAHKGVSKQHKATSTPEMVLFRSTYLSDKYIFRAGKLKQRSTGNTEKHRIPSKCGSAEAYSTGCCLDWTLNDEQRSGGPVPACVHIIVEPQFRGP